jgi:hypothetical protein
MRLLADVNVWVALAISRHIHHSDAVGWFDSLSDRDSVYFCRVTQQGFLRLVTTTAALGTDAVSNDLAWDGYLRLRRDPRIHWIEEPEGLDELDALGAGQGLVAQEVDGRLSRGVCPAARPAPGDIRPRLSSLSRAGLDGASRAES